MKVLGIDPGLDGAMAMWDGTELVLLEVPTGKAASRGREILTSVLNQEWDEKFFWAEHVFLERVASRPGQGVSSMFKFGLVYGIFRGMIAAKLIPMTLVTPSTWKKEMGVLQTSKEGSVIRASELFPAYASEFRGPKGGIKDGVAEAALIAYYGRQKLMKEAA